jgi:Spy/CpxP family protein refolding chaperone
VKKEIGLRPDQAKRIDDYYTRRMKEIDPVAQEYQKESAVLDKMVTDRLVDDSTLSLELMRYYTLRSSLGQSRAMMDYRIAKVLDLDQYAKLKAIADRRLKEAEARRGRGGGPNPAPRGLLR